MSFAKPQWIACSSRADQDTQASLLLMAQRWFDLANEPRSHDNFDAAVRVFNDAQMREASCAATAAPADSA
jgi:hypothetical protein